MTLLIIKLNEIEENSQSRGMCSYVLLFGLSFWRFNQSLRLVLRSSSSLLSDDVDDFFVLVSLLFFFFSLMLVVSLRGFLLLVLPIF